MSCPCITLLVCDECILISLCMCVCLLGVSALCDLSSASVICLSLGVAVFYLPTCNRPTILTIIILTLFVNPSMCAERKTSIECNIYGQ